VAIDPDGRLVGHHRGAGSNAWSGSAGGEAAVELLGEGLREALGDADARRVRGIVIGLAGATVRPQVTGPIRDLVASLGLGVEPLVVNDAEALFATGTAATDGYALVAGTGAIALAIRDTRSVASVDGNGWLLGDHGSATWIGLAAIRAVLGALDNRRPSTSLADELPAVLGSLAATPCRADSREIVVAAHALAPAALGRIAPLVDRHATAGDPIARGILRSAATELGSTLAAVIGRFESSPSSPIVIGGAVAYGSASIRRSLGRLCRRRWPMASVHVVRDGASGAALWARRLDGLAYDEGLLRALQDEVRARGFPGTS
jgi:N-acetylglucosamine kinase-like BadF-type ATPase